MSGEGQDSQKELQPIPTNTWEQIRETQLATPYEDILQAFLVKEKTWKANQKITFPEVEWKAAIQQQTTLANEMLTKYHNSDVIMNKPGKIFAEGIARPQIGEHILTRIYLGVDPRRSADAFSILLDQFSKAGCMKDISVAFNETQVEEGTIADNTIIIYEPQSRLDVLNKILSAYRSAKTDHPDIFNLTPNQKAAVMRSALKRYKAIVDANMSFIEMYPEDRGKSWDSDVVRELSSTFGLKYDVSPNIDDAEWVEKVKAGRNKVIPTSESRKNLDAGTVKPGDEIIYKRKLSSPGLIQRGAIITK